jgi:hypothetical protein
MKKGIIRICMLIILSAIFLDSSLVTSAEDCHECGNSAPTSAGDASYPEDWGCESHDLVALEFDDANTADTIAAGSSITINITGGLAPYTFATSSLGYTINGGQSYPTSSKSVRLTCTTGKCGTNYAVTAAITVMDSCGSKTTIKIRNTAGKWGDMVNDCPLGGYANTNTECIIGDKKYQVAYAAHLTESEGSCDCSEASQYGCPNLFFMDGYSSCVPNVHCAYIKNTTICTRFVGGYNIGALWAQHYTWICD